MIKRRFSRPIQVGSVRIGGGAEVVVQSMTKTDTRDVRATLRQIQELADCGCEVVRVAVPDQEAAEALGQIKKSSPIPIIADIHFDYRLALKALEMGVDQVRLNPGNIQDPKQVAAIAGAARERQVPLRVGVNAGSLPPGEGELAHRLAETALRWVRFLEDQDFEHIEVSLKAFDVLATVEANQLVAEQMPYPLHLGITESGPPRAGAIRSAAGLGILLHQGIGDSLRVSLSTPDPCEEVFVGQEILKALELRSGPELVSCPTCGRCEVDGFFEIVHEVERCLSGLEKPIRVAVMGCVVNGPGEAREADVGLACGKGRGVIFRKGEKVRVVEEKDYLQALLSEVGRL